MIGPDLLHFCRQNRIRGQNMVTLCNAVLLCTIPLKIIKNMRTYRLFWDWTNAHPTGQAFPTRKCKGTLESRLRLATSYLASRASSNPAREIFLGAKFKGRCALKRILTELCCSLRLADHFALSLSTTGV